MPSENQQVLRLRQTYLMRRFLLLALGMGFLLPTAANAEPIPKISDFKEIFEKPERIVFDCPKEVTKESFDGVIERVEKKLYEDCWIELNKDHINVMNKQKIERDDVLKFYEYYYYTYYGSVAHRRKFNFLYKTKKNYLARLEFEVSSGPKYGHMPRFERERNLIQLWMLNK